MLQRIAADHARVVLNDIDDDEVIACALASGASLIVSVDSDLPVLHSLKDIHILKTADAVSFVENARHGWSSWRVGA